MKFLSKLIPSTLFLFFFSINSTQAQISFDTVVIFKITDSIASHELKVFDENSSRQTGVPRMLEHYDRFYSFSEKNQLVFVYYSFNQKKFYGENTPVYDLSTGFPDFISISYNLATKKTRILPEG
jgi:hypothetical protein